MTLEHGALREKLIETTLVLMEKDGLDAVKARAVAGAVGVSVGTVYNLFGTIDGLILAANNRLLEALNGLGQARMTQLTRELEAGSTASPQSDRRIVLIGLLALSRVYIDFVGENSRSWTALLAFNRSRKLGQTDVEYLARQDALIDIIGAVLARSPLSGDAGLRRIAARALWSSVHGIVSMNYFGAEQARMRERTWAQIELLVSTFVAGLFAEASE